MTRPPTQPSASAAGPFFVVSLVVLGAASLAAASCGADSTDGDAPSGQELYATSCASCHGADLRGTDQGPSHLSIVYEPNHHGDDSFRAAIERGTQQHHWAFGDMDPIEGLDDEEIDAIIAFVRSEQQREGFEPYPP